MDGFEYGPKWCANSDIEELKTIMQLWKIALFLFSKTMLRGPDQYVRWLIRKEAHTRFGAFLSMGINARPAPLTDMRVFVPSTGVISDGFETFEYIFPRPMNGLT